MSSLEGLGGSDVGRNRASDSGLIPNVNFHMTSVCNMSCKFCFAGFKDIKQLGKNEALSVVRMLADSGFKKINFVGGEPTLVPWLKDVLIEARNDGLVTSIITNGWNIDRNWLDDYSKHLDWIGLSIDSLFQKRNSSLGRKVSGHNSPSYSSYLECLSLIREYDVKLKINTVVNRLNKYESFHDIIQESRPEKWKIFQVLTIENENPDAINFSIRREEFKDFLSRHSDLSSVTHISPEYCDDMKASYLIIDPAGRFVDNSTEKYHYSECILDAGVMKALHQVKVSKAKFDLRSEPGRLNNILTNVMI